MTQPAGASDNSISATSPSKGRRAWRTSDVARMVGVHPNTVRSYEAQGFLPPIPRAANGYRLYSDRHVDQMRLAWMAAQFTWVGGEIRRSALSIMHAGAEADFRNALARAESLRRLLTSEREHALAAADRLERWAAGEPAGEPIATPLTIGAAAVLLDVTIDTLRNWEQNHLIRVPRHPGNRYRQYGAAEIDRLWVIRALRKARYSTMSILRMMSAFERGQRQDLTRILDTPHPDEEVFVATDRWITTLSQMALAIEKLIAHARQMIDAYS